MNQLLSLHNASRWIAAVALSTLQSFAATASAQPLVKEIDEKSRLEVQRPANWFPQDKPNSATRFMYGFEGAGYGGNCNIILLESPSTAKLIQYEVDESENRKPLSQTFFERNLRNLSESAVVSRVVQTQIGDKWGHLVDYSYSYIDAATKKKIYVQNVMFSHSLPGKVLTFTCVTGATSADAATAALQNKLPAFNALIATSRFFGYFDGIDMEALRSSLEARKPKKELGSIDRWRYESCRESATKAPTAAGVNRGLRICDERYDQ